MTVSARRTRNVMGTAVTFHSKVELPDDVVDEAMAHLDWVDDTFSTFKESSDISRINAGTLPVEEAHELVHHALLRCAQLEDRTDGAFDYGRGGTLDPAGFVKGWAVDGAASILRSADIDSFLIWAGGDIVAHASGGTDPWRIGVRDPSDSAIAVDYIELTDGAVATSGTYERGNHIRGSTGAHASVTVTGPTLATADALATALFAIGLYEAEWLRRFPDHTVIAVTEDRKLLRTGTTPTAPSSTATAFRR